MMRTHGSNHGFSLIELLMAVSIMTVVATMLYTIFQTSVKVWNDTDAKMELTQSSRIFFDRLASDLETIRVDADKNMNFHLFKNGILFVNQGVYHNGATILNGYQEILYAYNPPAGTDTDFTDDTVAYQTRHSLSDSSFQFESSFTTITSGSFEDVITCVADFTVECWNHLTDEWMDWDAWPGSPANPYWNVLTAISSNDPDFMSYQPDDPSNKGRLPEKIRITLKLVPQDTAEWLNTINSSSLASFTQGQTGTNREKVIGALEDRKVLREYTQIIRLPQSPN